MYIVLAVILGLLFGYALYLAGATSPKTLVSMLRLQDLSLMKIIVFGIGFASVLLSIFGLLGWFNIGHLSIKGTHLGVIIGGLLFGIGFGTIGTCPGTCVAASGSGGGQKAASAVIGGLLGALFFSMTYGFWVDAGLYKAMNLGSLTLFHISEKYPSVFPFGFEGLLLVGGLFIAVAYFLPIARHSMQSK